MPPPQCTPLSVEDGSPLQIFDWNDPEDLHRAREVGFDMAVDLTTVNLAYWKERSHFLSQLPCHAVGCGHVTRFARTYGEYLDLGKSVHSAERMAQIFTRITGKRKGRILPAVPPVTPESSVEAERIRRTLPEGRRVVYVNTTGAETDRSFSAEQIAALAEIFEASDTLYGLFYVREPKTFPYQRNVGILPVVDFRAVPDIVSHCCAVISPDTSVVHMSSALGVPCLGFFCANDVERYPTLSKERVWGPLAPGSRAYVHPYAKRSDRVEPLSAIPKVRFDRVVREFLESL